MLEHRNMEQQRQAQMQQQQQQMQQTQIDERAFKERARLEREKEKAEEEKKKKKKLGKFLQDDREYYQKAGRGGDDPLGIHTLEDTQVDFVQMQKDKMDPLMDMGGLSAEHQDQMNQLMGTVAYHTMSDEGTRFKEDLMKGHGLSKERTIQYAKDYHAFKQAVEEQK